MFQRLKLAVLFLAFVAAIGIVGTSHVAHTGANNEEVALSLATLLRSARAVISDNQKHINDASKGDKGLSSQVVLAKAKAHYKKATGVDIGSIDGASLQGELLKTAIDSIVEVMNEAQSLINKEGVSFKGFLPVVFARLVIEKFRARKGAIAGSQADCAEAIRSQPGEPTGRLGTRHHRKPVQVWLACKRHARVGHVGQGRQAGLSTHPAGVYYKASCLSCHGEPKGELDITGGKKEGGTLGEVGGAISIVLYQ